MVFSILPKTNENHYPEHFPLWGDAQDSKFCSFFERIEDTIIFFQDFQSFSDQIDNEITFR